MLNMHINILAQLMQQIYMHTQYIHFGMYNRYLCSQCDRIVRKELILIWN